MLNQNFFGRKDSDANLVDTRLAVNDLMNWYNQIALSDDQYLFIEFQKMQFRGIAFQGAQNQLNIEYQHRIYELIYDLIRENNWYFQIQVGKWVIKKNVYCFVRANDSNILVQIGHGLDLTIKTIFNDPQDESPNGAWSY